MIKWIKWSNLEMSKSESKVVATFISSIWIGQCDDGLSFISFISVMPDRNVGDDAHPALIKRSMSVITKTVILATYKQGLRPILMCAVEHGSTMCEAR